jgi:hypothetical protein
MDTPSKDHSESGLRKVMVAVRDSALEQWPVLKLWYALFSAEVSAVRRGWVVFTVMAIATNYFTWHVTFSYMKKQISDCF